jgi:hypothetical protein
MKIKNILFNLTIIAVSVLALSCDKDDESGKPKITIIELGYDNSKTVVAGTELHLDVEIEAPNNIKTVKLSIHGESSTAIWEFEQVYTEYEGKKNIDFHKHIDIPAEAAVGHYHLHIEVTDLKGYSAEAEDEIEITAAK